MRAFLIAAGAGTRLRPLTDRTPKCLIAINGIPLLGRWLTACHDAGVQDVLVNTHHLADQVEAYLKENDFGPTVCARHEPELLGTAGTVCANLAWVRDDRDFLVIYADNYASLDLARLVASHRERQADMTLVVCPTDIPKEKGIVTLDPAGRVLSFVEKPACPETNLMNGGMYVVSTGFMHGMADELGKKRPLDFGYDVLPRAVAGGKVYAHRLDSREFVTDIGTPGDYARVLGGDVA